MNIIWENYVWDEEHKATPEQVKAIEYKLNIVFPNDYLDVAMKEHGKTPEPCGLPISKGSSVVTTLLHFEDDPTDKDNYNYSIIRQHNLLSEDQNPLLIPFAKASGASMFCFDFRNSKKSPSIIFNDSDSEGDEAIISVAKDFTEFISMLEK